LNKLKAALAEFFLSPGASSFYLVYNANLLYLAKDNQVIINCGKSGKNGLLKPTCKFVEFATNVVKNRMYKRTSMFYLKVYNRAFDITRGGRMAKG